MLTKISGQCKLTHGSLVDKSC